jgi:hypothetical protein
MDGFFGVRLPGTNRLATASHLTGCDPQLVKRHARLKPLVVLPVVLDAICEF